jgi:hypothetical protein
MQRTLMWCPTIKWTVVHLSGGGGDVPRGGVAGVGAGAGPMCPPRPAVSPRQDPRHGDGGVACREGPTWAPWGALCPRGALPDAARLDAFERPTAPVFCNKRNPSHSADSNSLSRYFPQINCVSLFKFAALTEEVI